MAVYRQSATELISCNAVRAGIELVLLAALAPTLALSSQQQGHHTKGAALTCPDSFAWTGKYVNYSYGFSVVIPTGFKGYWNSAACVAAPDGCTCMSDHGRIIPLTAEPYEPERHIEIYAGYASDLDEPTVAGEVDRNLKRIGKRSRDGSVSALKQSSVNLGGLKAQRVAARYYDSRLDQWMVEDFIEALRDGDVEYSVYLRTSEGNYEHDRNALESVVSTFKLRKRR
jgi:hypothetical protein